MTLKSKKDEWRSRLKASKKAERRQNLIVLGVMVMVPLIVYLWWTDDLKFLGRRTKLVPAAVTKVTDVDLGRRYYYQEAEFEYIVDGETYEVTFDIWKNRHPVREGDTLMLKIAVSNPSISRLP